MLAFFAGMWYPLKVVSESARHAAVAQLDRVTGYEPVGRGFESLLPYQKDIPFGMSFFFLFVAYAAQPSQLPLSLPVGTTARTEGFTG